VREGARDTGRPARSLIPGAAVQLVLVGAAVLALWPLLGSGGWPQTHEKLRYLVLTDLFSDAVRHGIWYPRYLPDLYGGYGYPLFCFYQPGFFYWALPFSLLPLAAHQSLALALLALLYAGGLGAYLLGRQLTDRLWGLFAGLWFLLTPYLFVNLYVRGDLSELAGMLACPWAVFTVLRLADRLERRRRATAASFGWAAACFGLLVFHPVPALVMLPLLCMLTLVLGWGRPHRNALVLHFGLALVLALALTAPYWLTLLQLRDQVGLERLVEGYFRPELRGAAVQLGAPHLALAVLGGWLGRRRRPILAGAVAYVLLVSLVLQVAAPVWERAGFLRYLQFPWRLLGVTATLQLVAALGVQRLAVGGPRSIPAGWQAAGLGVLLATAAVWHADQLTVRELRGPAPTAAERLAEASTDGFGTLGGKVEYLPRTARARPAAPRDSSSPPLRLEGPGWLRPIGEPDPYRLRYELATPDAVSLVIEQVYLPGWRVRVDGRELPRPELEAGLTPEGFMRVELSGGAQVHRLEAGYEGPPGWQLRDAVIAAVTLGCVVGLLAAGRRSRGTSPRGSSGRAS
jgi:hypothetical protein